MKDDHASPPATSVPGWQEFVDTLRDLPERMLAKLPEHVRNDPHTAQEVCHRILAALTYSTFDALAGDGDYPVFRPGVGFVISSGQPNADTSYRLARITPEGTYRLRGQRGSLRIAIVAQRGPFPCEPGGDAARTMPGASLAHHDLNALRVDAQGRFDVILSPTRPAGYDGDWWQLLPTTNKLWLRGVKADWAAERDPTVSIERLDIPLGGRPRQSAAVREHNLRWLPPAVVFGAITELEHVENLRRGGYLNDKTTYYDTTDIVGLEDQHYFECAYDLTEDEALLIEARLPVCAYWSAMLSNEIFQTVDWYNCHSSLNDTQAKADADGIVRFVICAKDPGVPNWLDTTGYPTGQFQGRWYRADAPSLPKARKIPFGDIRKNLPPETRHVTAEERDRTIRERRMWLQQRTLW